MATDEKREKSEECDCCHFPTADLTLYESSGIDRHLRIPNRWLCALCAATPAGTADVFPAQYQGQREILRTICYVGNSILAELRRRGEASNGHH